MIEKYHKELKKYCDNAFCVLVPVWYDNETKPAWRRIFTGTKKECDSVFASAPDHIIASYEENRRNRENKLKELIFYRSIGQNKKAAAIASQYNL